MRPFRCHFTAAVWRHGLVLVGGALLAPGRRTVAAALRVMGFAEAAGFAAYHRVLSHGHWCSRALAQRLLLLLVAAFVPHGPVVVGLDDTIERRRGKRITRKGIYRDPVRSSRGHFVKASGLRWLCVMLLAPVPWAGCVWALPFLTVLMWTAGARQRISARLMWTAGARQRISPRLDAPIGLTGHGAATAKLREAPRVRGTAGIEAPISVGERSGQLRPYVRPVARRSPLAIMGVRVRVRRQSGSRARGTTRVNGFA